MPLVPANLEALCGPTRGVFGKKRFLNATKECLRRRKSIQSMHPVYLHTFQRSFSCSYCSLTPGVFWMRSDPHGEVPDCRGP